jgi:hypothetical protein
MMSSSLSVNASGLESTLSAVASVSAMDAAAVDAMVPSLSTALMCRRFGSTLAPSLLCE